MTARPVDLTRVSAALRALDAHVKAHPELTGEDARERCAAWLAGEEPDENAVEPVEPDSTGGASSAERRPKRPTTRGD